MKRLKRYFFMLKLLMMGGYKRADYLKKKKYFKHQGEHCYFQPWNFGTEPYLISCGKGSNICKS